MKNNVSKTISLVSIILLFSIAIGAQNKWSNELSVWGATGVSSLQNKTLNIADSKARMGGTFGVGYGYSLTPQIALLSGLELASYNSKATIASIVDKYSAMDNENSVLDAYSSHLQGYEEKQEAIYLQIPLMLQYQMLLSQSSSFYVSGGLKIGLPIKKSYKNSYQKLTTTGHYSDWNLTIDELLEQGFGVYESKKSDGDLHLKTSYMTSMETGVKWKMSDNMVLYTGIYFDYGLNNVNKYKADKTLVTYNPKNPESPNNHSITESFYTENAVTANLVDKITPISFGVKIKLGLGW